MDSCPLRPCGFCMLNCSASASSSSDRNFLPVLCLGLLAWLPRGAGVCWLLLAEDALRRSEAWEKKCCVWDAAGPVVEGELEALDELATFDAPAGGCDIPLRVPRLTLRLIFYPVQPVVLRVELPTCRASQRAALDETH